MTEITTTVQNIVDFIFGVGLFFNGALFIPQAITLLRQKHAREVSLFTFAGFCILQIFTILHGYFHNDYLLMWGICFSLLTCGTVNVLIVYYRIKDKTNSKKIQLTE